MQYLDLSIVQRDRHLCRQYSPRTNKSLLPYTSAHTRLVKRGIVQSCHNSALNKSCERMIPSRFRNQVGRLGEARYPEGVIRHIAEVILNSLERHPQAKERERKRPIVMPYIHKVSHSLKNVGCRCGVDVLFSAPRNLCSLWAATDPNNKQKITCDKEHENMLVKYTTG